MSDLIDKQNAVIEIVEDAISKIKSGEQILTDGYKESILSAVKAVLDEKPEVIHCEDCKFYIPMNRETKTGICSLIMHQNFGDNWYCAGAERKC